MKRIFKSTLLIFLGAALLTVTSCSKDDDTPDPPPTEKSKLTNKDFVVSDYNVVINGAVYETYSDLASCVKDDIIRFLDDNSGSVDEGNTKCDPGDPQTTHFTWAFQSSDKKLKIQSDGDATVYDIKINNGTTLKLEYTQVDDFDGDGQNDTGVISITYTKE